MRMTPEEFSARQRENQIQAEAYAAAVRENAGDVGLVRENLAGYIRCKFFLEPADMTGDDIRVLSDAGTEKLASLRRGGLEFADKASGCTSAASSVIKKALLMLSLGRTLKLTFDPDVTAGIDTISELAELVCAMLREADRDA